MRRGSLIRDLDIIVESLYKGRMKAIRFGKVDVGSQGDQITADGTNACMQCTLCAGSSHSIQIRSSIRRDACCLGLVIRAEQSLVYKPRKKKGKKGKINPFSLARQRAQPRPLPQRFQPVEFVAHSKPALLRARRASCGQPCKSGIPQQVFSSQLSIPANCLPHLPARRK